MAISRLLQYSKTMVNLLLQMIGHKLYIYIHMFRILQQYICCISSVLLFCSIITEITRPMCCIEMLGQYISRTCPIVNSPQSDNAGSVRTWWLISSSTCAIIRLCGCSITVDLWCGDMSPRSCWLMKISTESHYTTRHARTRS